MTDRDREILCCVGVTESMTQRLQTLPAGKFNACELRDIYRTLRDLEDRLWGQGEYAPENVAPTGNPRFLRVKQGVKIQILPLAYRQTCRYK